jgi:hypothetical protein
MASQHLATISGPRSKPCEQQKRSSLLRHWLGLFALNAGQPLDADALSVYASLWLEGFADLSDEVLEAAFKKTLATCKFWPVKIADVREHVESAEDSRTEDEWQRLLEYCRRHVNADLGMAHAPKLPADIAHAADSAGGLFYLESCPTDELQWAKKRFAEDLARQRKAGDIAACLPDSPLGKQLEATAVRFTLPSATAPALPSIPDDWHPSEDAQPGYGLQPERDPQFAALVKQGEQRYRESAERVFEQYRREHHL